MAEGLVSASVRQGALLGRRCEASTGRAFLSFEGVPYARPPVGPLRFKAPQPPEPWTGLRDATKVGSECLHYDVLAKKFLGSEDCLYLNVYTPDLPSESKSASLRPVMVYIHGGGFAIGCGHLYHPEPFMDEGAVVVNFNYRLGPLGFLGLGTLDVPGNAGLKDQTMALRWVQENIAVFGGDPNNVTIFGESAGGASVHYQLLSPLAKGLFQRVIAQSGSALCPWALSRDPLGRARRLALAAGCPPTTADDPAALANWLREVAALTLILAIDASVEEELNPSRKLIPFVPCVEPAHPGAFITREPAAIIASGDVPRLPVIFGITTHEGIMFLPGCMLQLSNFCAPRGGVERSPAETAAAEARALAEIAAEPGHLLPEGLPQGRRTEHEQRLKDFFFGGQPPSVGKGLVDVYSDVQFVLGALRSARGHARLGSPVYVYEFAYSGRVNFLSNVLRSAVRGVCHADELTYLFNLPELPRPEKDSRDALVRRRIVRLWANFAKNGNPSPLDEVINTQWLQFSESSPHYLKIDEELTTETGLFKERMLFWRDLYSTR